MKMRLFAAACITASFIASSAFAAFQVSAGDATPPRNPIPVVPKNCYWNCSTALTVEQCNECAAAQCGIENEESTPCPKIVYKRGSDVHSYDCPNPPANPRPPMPKHCIFGPDSSLASDAVMRGIYRELGLQ